MLPGVNFTLFKKDAALRIAGIAILARIYNQRLRYSLFVVILDSNSFHRLGLMLNMKCPGLRSLVTCGVLDFDFRSMVMLYQGHPSLTTGSFSLSFRVERFKDDIV